MNVCYVDESGTSSIPGNTSHFVLAGFSIPIEYWKNCDISISTLKNKYMISDSEIHIGWLLRPYYEQNKITNFANLDYSKRKSEVLKVRRAEIYRLKEENAKNIKQIKKNFRLTECYIHLTLDERKALVFELAEMISNWNHARLFAECIDKVHFDPTRAPISLDAQAFEQIVSRYEQYLENSKYRVVSGKKDTNYGLIIHDNNDTVAKKHTQLMKDFHKRGTFWTEIKNIIETPFFVDSQLTGLVQVADLCAYAIRRYCENGEEDLFRLIFKRADRSKGVVVGVRHFSDADCQCEICKAHNRR